MALEESENIATFLHYNSLIAFQLYRIFHIIWDTSFPDSWKAHHIFIIYIDDCIIQTLMTLLKEKVFVHLWMWLIEYIIRLIIDEIIGPSEEFPWTEKTGS